MTWPPLRRRPAPPIKPNAVLGDVPRSKRRLLLKEEERRRKSGDWGRWDRFNLPSGLRGSTGGWPLEIRAAWRNAVFAVLERPLPGARHLAVSSLSGIRPTWHEMQRIKNEIAGDAATAIEIYPPADQLVDEADMFHLWVIDGPLPFTIFEAARAAASSCPPPERPR